MICLFQDLVLSTLWLCFIGLSGWRNVNTLASHRMTTQNRQKSNAKKKLKNNKKKLCFIGFVTVLCWFPKSTLPLNYVCVYIKLYFVQLT